MAVSQNQTLETKFDETAKPEGENLSSLGLNLKITGSYQALRNILTAISELPYHTRLNSLKTDNIEGKLTAQIGLQLFMKKF